MRQLYPNCRQRVTGAWSTVKWWFRNGIQVLRTLILARRFTSDSIRLTWAEVVACLGEKSAIFDPNIEAHEVDHSPLWLETSETERVLLHPRAVRRSMAQSSYLASIAQSIDVVSDQRLAPTRIERGEVAARLITFFESDSRHHMTLCIEMEPELDFRLFSLFLTSKDPHRLCSCCGQHRLSIVIFAYDTESWRHVKKTFIPDGLKSFLASGFVKFVDIHHGPLLQTAPRRVRPHVIVDSRVSFGEEFRFEGFSSLDTSSSGKINNRVTLHGAAKYLRPTIRAVLTDAVDKVDGISLETSLGLFLAPQDLKKSLISADAVINVSWRPNANFQGLYVSGSVFLAMSSGCQLISFRPSRRVSLATMIGVPSDFLWEFRDESELVALLRRLNAETRAEKTDRRQKLADWREASGLSSVNELVRATRQWGPCD